MKLCFEVDKDVLLDQSCNYHYVYCTTTTTTTAAAATDDDGDDEQQIY